MYPRSNIFGKLTISSVNLYIISEGMDLVNFIATIFSQLGKCWLSDTFRTDELATIYDRSSSNIWKAYLSSVTLNMIFETMTAVNLLTTILPVREMLVNFFRQSTLGNHLLAWDKSQLNRVF